MYRNILVPLDGSKLAECVLPHVESIARGCGTKSVTFVRVAEPVPLLYASEEGYAFSAKDIARMEAESTAAAEHYLNQLIGQVKYPGVEIKAEVLKSGPAADMISEYATKTGADLIVIATHGRSGISRWIWGSVADRILRSAGVPVLMVRAPGCVPGI